MSVVPTPPRIFSSDKTWKQWSSGIKGHRFSLRCFSCCPPGISGLQLSAMVSLPLSLGVSLWLLCHNWGTRTWGKATFSWSRPDILLSGVLLNPRKHHRQQRLCSDRTGFWGLSFVLSPARSISFESDGMSESPILPASLGFYIKYLSLCLRFQSLASRIQDHLHTNYILFQDDHS